LDAGVVSGNAPLIAAPASDQAGGPCPVQWAISARLALIEPIFIATLHRQSVAMLQWRNVMALYHRNTKVLRCYGIAE
jgi:hypothetical protein